jgi:hypothetical protein
LLLGTSVALLVIDAGCNEVIVDCVPRCDGNTKVSCNGGLVDGVWQSTREDCGSRTCVEDFRTYERYAACAIAGRDQRCNPEIDDVFCDGDAIGFCRGAFLEGVTDCKPSGRTCAVRSSGNAHDGRCVSSSALDPRCPPGAERRPFCDGDFLALCFDRFLERASTPCSARGKRCAADATNAACE